VSRNDTIRALSPEIKQGVLIGDFKDARDARRHALSSTIIRDSTSFATSLHPIDVQVRFYPCVCLSVCLPVHQAI